MQSVLKQVGKRSFSSKAARNVVIVDGGRIPFSLAGIVLKMEILCVYLFMIIGTLYNEYLAVDLARFAIKGLLVKTAVDPSKIDYLCMGSVIAEPRTSK
jgi:acetyl-CoA acetyltransferase